MAATAQAAAATLQLACMRGPVQRIGGVSCKRSWRCGAGWLPPERRALGGGPAAIVSGDEAGCFGMLTGSLFRERGRAEVQLFRRLRQAGGQLSCRPLQALWPAGAAASAPDLLPIVPHTVPSPQACLSFELGARKRRGGKRGQPWLPAASSCSATSCWAAAAAG